MELGSEFNLALSQLSVKSKNIFQYLSGFSYVYYFDSGRSALKHIALHMNDDDEVLLPEFICESVTNCFKQKRISFYKLTSDFAVDINDLERKISSDTRLVFLMHYFGKVQPKTVLDRMVAVAKGHGSLIIEDTTHSIFTKAHTIGDY